jgi:RNA polymerase sigma-70 factor (ECF subfamily)
MLLRGADEAEDAVQSTFLAAHGALLRGGVPRDEAAWLFAIARNECRGRIRARMQTPLAHGAEALASVPAPDGDPANRLVDPVVRNALAALPQRQREAVVLHDVLGLRAREVCRVLGVTLPAAEALLFRARRQLRVRLQPVAGALTLPVGIRDALAQAIPGFADAPAAAGTAVTGAAGIGLFAKLAATPAAAKVAAATVAVTAAGTVAASERGHDPSPAPRTSVVAEQAGPTAPASRPVPVSPVSDTGPGPVSTGKRAAGEARSDHGRSDDADDRARGSDEGAREAGEPDDAAGGAARAVDDGAFADRAEDADRSDRDGARSAAQVDAESPDDAPSGSRSEQETGDERQGSSSDAAHDVEAEKGGGSEGSGTSGGAESGGTSSDEPSSSDHAADDAASAGTSGADAESEDAQPEIEAEHEGTT